MCQYFFGMLSFLLGCSFFSCGLLSGEDLQGREISFFENRIRPVLVRNCYQCHSDEAKKHGGKLSLDTRQGLLLGGETGPAIVKGKPHDSLIIKALRYEGLQMPPDDPLPESVIEDFMRWIQMGAIDPRGESKDAATLANDPSALWSFQEMNVPKLSSVEKRLWPIDPLDTFVLGRLESAGLKPNPDASPRQLIRRLYHDLLGLPPNIDEVEQFVANYQKKGRPAVEDLVDHLLAQNQFGVRWGRHWLDVARFGESNGDDGLGRNAAFPHAWRYRDYVIDALNQDLPYDRFITEQIAGDLLPAKTAGDRNRQLVATGFLAIGSKPAAAMNNAFAMDIIDDQINTVCTALTGISVACARCHDHKHDPITTRDYYSLAGIFLSTETLYGLAGNEKLTAPPTPLHKLVSQWPAGQSNPGTIPQFPASYSKDIDRLNPFLHAKLDSPHPNLKIQQKVNFSESRFAHFTEPASLQGNFDKETRSYSVSFWFKNQTPNNQRPITVYLFSRAEYGDKSLLGDHLGIGGTHDKSVTGKLFVFNGNVPDSKSIKGQTVIEEGVWNHVVLIRNQDQIQLFLNGNESPEIDEDLPNTLKESSNFCFGSRSDGFAPLAGNLAEMAVFDRPLNTENAQYLHTKSGQPRGNTTLGVAMGVREKAKPTDCKIHINGNKGKLGKLVPRGFPVAYQKVTPLTQPGKTVTQIGEQSSGRLELARWLTHPQHPQTARVMVNRIWLQLFGQGIVATPNDFGVYGARPTHPELLDHLAKRFVLGDWSIKKIIRSIVLSRTYQLSSQLDSQLATVDPENRLLARHNRRRLDAESLRDSILLASGNLDLSPGQGSAVETTVALINWPLGASTNLHRENYHRSIYLCQLRHAPPPELSAFDLPDGVKIVGQREVSNLPTQSLFLMNNPLIVSQAGALARQVLTTPGKDDVEKVRNVFRRVLRRDPTLEEISHSTLYLKNVDLLLSPRNPDGNSRQEKTWSSLCHALMASNEFRYID
nr:DUF1553 domain-containing protein [Mariniblastus sp.]